MFPGLIISWLLMGRGLLYTHSQILNFCCLYNTQLCYTHCSAIFLSIQVFGSSILWCQVRDTHFYDLVLPRNPQAKVEMFVQGHPHSEMCCGVFSLAAVPALTELLPSAEHAAGSWTPGTLLHVTHPRPPPPGRSPQPCSADEDKPFLVAAAAPALSHQVFNVSKLSCPWAPLSLSCRPASL